MKKNEAKAMPTATGTSVGVEPVPSEVYHVEAVDVYVGGHPLPDAVGADWVSSWEPNGTGAGWNDRRLCHRWQRHLRYGYEW